jgi:hypothetical protein
MNIYNEITLNFTHEFQFFHDGLNTFLVHYSGLQHFFHSVHLAIFFHTPYFTKTATTDGIVKLEIGFRNLIKVRISIGIILGAKIGTNTTVTHYIYKEIIIIIINIIFN